MSDDPTLDPSLRSWVMVPEDSDFPIQNLPLGQIDRGGNDLAAAVRIGDHVLDLRGAADAGVLDVPRGGLTLLHGLLFLERPKWRALRERVSELLSDPRHRAAVAPHVRPVADVEVLLPVRVRDYVDFYSSIEHATNLGRMFRPHQEPLLPNWRWLPVGYHGRGGTIVPSGAPVHRPRGIVRRGDAVPAYEPSGQLDVELEMGFLTGGAPNRPGEPIPIDRAGQHIVGLVLVNDWSARDVQAFEYQPLGPFLGKSFATSISPWIVTLDALAPYRVPGPGQDPPPLPHLRTDEPWAFDIELEMALQTPGMPEPATISRTNLRHLYWSMAQQLAHATSNGASAQPGDLFATGTISGADPGTQGSLIELTWGGERPLELPDGSTRTFLEDGDTVVLRAWAGGDGRPRIGFGECRGTILPG
jgi:fumarylacetoacetase